MTCIGLCEIAKWNGVAYANGVMRVVVGELRHNIADEYGICMQLFDEYAIEMYGCKLTYDILYNNT